MRHKKITTRNSLCNCRWIERKGGRIYHHLIFQPTVDEKASAKDLQEAEDIFGKGKVIRARKDLPGIVHPATLKLRQDMAKRGELKEDSQYLIKKDGLWVKKKAKGKEWETPLCLGLSCTLAQKTTPTGELKLNISWMCRSTMQFDVFRTDSLGRNCFLLAHINHLDYNGFNYFRDYSAGFYIARTIPISPFSNLIHATTAILLKSKIFQTYDVKGFISSDSVTKLVNNLNDEWRTIQEEKDLKKIAEYLLQTIYINSALLPGPAGRFWHKETDKKRVELALKRAQELKLNIDLNAIPIKFKDSPHAKPALYFAMYLGKIDVADYLIDNGANFKVNWLGEAIRANQKEKNPLFADYYQKLVRLALITNIENNESKELKALFLLKKSPYGKFDIDKPIKDNLTPLMLAAKIGNLELVKMLIEEKANFNIKNEQQETALTIAISQNHTAVVEYLKKISEPQLKLTTSIFGKNASKRKYGDGEAQTNEPYKEPKIDT